MPSHYERPTCMTTTFDGFVFDTTDALLLFEAAFRRILPIIPRRLVPGEYKDLVKSGSIFVYEENASGIRRWTDGRSWSPSRVLDNFLVYRESEKITTAAAQNKGIKRKRPSDSDDHGPGSETDSVIDDPSFRPRKSLKASTTESAPVVHKTREEKEFIKSLAGSFTDVNLCRENGLIKRTMSVVVNGLSHHLVSYYTINDIRNGVLQRPSRDSRLRQIAIRPALYKQNFRQAVYSPYEHSYMDAGRSNPDLYLSVAPGSQQIQLRQSTTVKQPSYNIPSALPLQTLQPVSSSHRFGESDLQSRVYTSPRSNEMQAPWLFRQDFGAGLQTPHESAPQNNLMHHYASGSQPHLEDSYSSSLFPIPQIQPPLDYTVR